MDSYINLPLIPRSEDSQFDILEYWKTQAISFPVLAQMARDVLAIPITFFASESSFSIGGRIVNKLRAKLLPKNVEIFVTTRNWLYGFEPEENDEDYLTVVHRLFNSKSFGDD